MASPTSYVITPTEVQALKERLASLGIVSLPAQSQGQNRRGGPAHQRNRSRSGSEGGFSQPVSGVQSSAPSRPASPSALFPPSRTASFLRDDDMLPLTSRHALRAGAMGLTAGWAMDALLPLILRKKSATAALKGIFSRVPVRTAFSMWLYVFLYRTLLQLMHRIRAQLIARAARSASQVTAVAARNANISEVKPYSLRGFDEMEESQPGGSTANKAVEAEEELAAEHSVRTRLYLRFWRMLRSPMLPPFLAALSASIPALPFLPSDPIPRRSLAVWVFTQGIRWAFLEARRSDAQAVKWVPTWIGGALWYAIGNAQLLYAFLFHSDCFPTSYGKFILSRSSGYAPPRPQHLPSSIAWPSQRVIVDHIGQLSTPTRTSSAFPAFSSPLLSALKPSPYPTTDFSQINPVLDYGPAHPAHTSLVCAIMHPAEPSCKRNATEFWKREWWGAARFVAGFAALGNVLAWSKVAKDPETALFRFLLSTIQGATVITGSISTAWSLICFFQHYLPRSFIPRYRYFLNGLIASVWILAVPTRRRSELGNYVGRLSMQSSWELAVKKKKVKSIKNGDLILMAFGIATLTALFEERPRALTGAVRTALARITGPRQGGIGVPSSMDPGMLQAAASQAAEGSGSKQKRTTRGISMTSVWPR
ncbi:hypothetical protein CF319_g1795 [Tilletia indica]|uniref:Transmembrane protein 135 N-terminal domain-containing protein n=1 Tax=Tilletia indica TaxID=43049 RepID=A0A177THX6_9BASI|nr:hypothetical protein CF319_g1795 [Tilletia indica]KAE8231986.1 hypothetical protein CF326_g2982 [Tilletia indica]KAE8257468.1 hypothetical protein A4X13_0g2326 [Tilletia indica]